MTTSGSTGAPKLVRLSHRNVTSNAHAIIEYLGLDESDRGITSLPLHYCYGLSVLHSHLLAGASLVLTEASVVDPCFAAAMHHGQVTNLAGVPHTFDLLDRAGPDTIRTPSLRLVTQAGGRMAPERVTEWVARTEGWGAEFFVMYGQTEATARIAYLPPQLARRRPGAIGVPIPGGSIDVRPLGGSLDGVGELVYRGPNVMLGYTCTGDDLALGTTLDELRTGDLARFDADAGVFEIVGRASRLVKPFGLRIDLDAIERELAAQRPRICGRRRRRATRRLRARRRSSARTRARRGVRRDAASVDRRRRWRDPAHGFRQGRLRRHPDRAVAPSPSAKRRSASRTTQP